jgi:cation:H+ antiporter
MVVFELAVLLISVFVLSRAATTTVDNVDKLARFFRIEQVAIGFILLSVSTSLPELAISVVSSTHGNGGIAAGNVFGSNIANILLVLGLGGFIYGMRINAALLRDIGLILVLTTVISVYIIFNSSVQGRALNFPEGAMLLGLFGLYVWHTLRNKKKVLEDGTDKVSRKQALNAFLLFGAGIIAVIVSSGFVVEYAVKLAAMLGLAESFIGATIIAIGTSLPEISIDLLAIRKKHYGLALGDAIGSNMTNLTLVLGSASVLGSIHVQLPVFIAALLFAVVANMLLLYVAAVNKSIQRLGGILFLSLYALFLIMMFMLQARELGMA